MSKFQTLPRRATSSPLLAHLRGHQTMLDGLTALEPLVHDAIRLMGACLAGGGRIFLCGNGGSAADCQHFAAELVGRLVLDRLPLAAIALTTDSSALTAIANDYGYDQVFSRQLSALGRKNDVLVAISTSGRSLSVVRAVETANAMGIRTVGLLGRDGGSLAPLCNCAIVAPASLTAHIQEAHGLLAHVICAGIEDYLGVGGGDHA